MLCPCPPCCSASSSSCPPSNLRLYLLLLMTLITLRVSLYDTHTYTSTQNTCAPLWDHPLHPPFPPNSHFLLLLSVSPLQRFTSTLPFRPLISTLSPHSHPPSQPRPTALNPPEKKTLSHFRRKLPCLAARHFKSKASFQREALWGGYGLGIVCVISVLRFPYKQTTNTDRSLLLNEPAVTQWLLPCSLQRMKPVNGDLVFWSCWENVTFP